MCHQKRALLACMFMFPTFNRTPAMLKSYAGVLVQGFIQQFWENAHCQNWEKIIHFTAKLGKIMILNVTMGAKFILKMIFFRFSNAYVSSILISGSGL